VLGRLAGRRGYGLRSRPLRALAEQDRPGTPYPPGCQALRAGTRSAPARPATSLSHSTTLGSGHLTGCRRRPSTGGMWRGGKPGCRGSAHPAPRPSFTPGGATHITHPVTGGLTQSRPPFLPGARCAVRSAHRARPLRSRRTNPAGQAWTNLPMRVRTTHCVPRTPGGAGRTGLRRREPRPPVRVVAEGLVLGFAAAAEGEARALGDDAALAVADG
jgi:hypothetical protein